MRKGDRFDIPKLLRKTDGREPTRHCLPLGYAPGLEAASSRANAQTLIPALSPASRRCAAGAPRSSGGSSRRPERKRFEFDALRSVASPHRKARRRWRPSRAWSKSTENCGTLNISRPSWAAFRFIAYFVESLTATVTTPRSFCPTMSITGGCPSTDIPSIRSA